MKTGSALVIVGLFLSSAYAQDSQATDDEATAQQDITTPAEQPTPEPASVPEVDPVDEIQPFSLDSATMTDNWFGVGDALDEIGIHALFIYNHQYMSVFHGRQHETRGDSATYDFLLTLDFEKMGLWKNGDALLHVREQWNDSINRFTGAIEQVNDDADGDRCAYVDQLWYRHYFLDRKINLKLGYLDYQTIVDRNTYASSEDTQFMNSAMDNNPLIPTASATGLGAALTIDPCDWYSLILGAGDAERLPLYKPGFSTTFHDNAWFLGFMEHNLKPTIPTDNGPLKGNYRIGMVYDPLPRSRYLETWEHPRPQLKGNNTAFYLNFDQKVFLENDQSDQGLGVFFRYSHVDDDTYRFDNFYSGGVSYTGLIPTRNKDVFGFAIAVLSDSDKYRDRVSANSGNETIYEWYYSIQITPWFIVSPDIQYIDNPGANDSLSHAFVGGLRFRLIF